MNTGNNTAEYTYHFLQGGGEMGALTREYDWSQTSIGTPDKWPQSLRTTVSIMLSSKFPMLIFWGDDLVSFYNDAFRPSLGNNGKHPGSLGKKGEEVWPEIWDIIKPLLDTVKNEGEAIWNDDQLIPIYRNGRIEDVYWTYSYSPIQNESGNIGGIFVVCTETTDKIINLRKVEESKEQLEFAIDAAELATFDLNPATGKFTANERLRTWFGLEHSSEIELQDAIDAIAAQDRERVAAAIQQALDISSGGHYDVEYTIINPATKKEIIVRAKGRTWFNEGVAYRFNGTLQDVTAQVAARKQLEDTEQQTRSIIDSAPFPIGVYLGREMRIAFANKSILDVWGKGRDVIGKLYSEILPELENQRVFGQLDRVFTTGIPFHARNQHLELVVNGKVKTFFFNYSFTPLTNKMGEVYGVMNTAADVTDLNVAKQKIEENERSVRNTILKAPVAMCIFRGPQHIVEVANERILELWGRPAEQLMNRPIFEGLPEASGQGFEALLDGVYNTGESFSASDVPINLPRGDKLETIYVNFVYAANKESDGVISGVIAVATDVTAQVLARQKIEEIVAERTQELASVNNNLQRSNAELAQYAYIASHDLQEPLRKVSTYMQMLERSLGDDVTEQSNGYIGKINVATARMITLIRDVLAYSQLSKEREVFVQVALQHVIDDIKTDFELLIEQKGASIIYKDLPTIDGIPLQMSQLFGNLVSNALKFSREDVAPVIQISSTIMAADEVNKYFTPDAHTTYYNIAVKDNGIGFNPEYADRIFNIFQRLHGRAEYAGTGIGLAMCKKIAQNHHGDIYATTGNDGGAIFNVILPQQQVL